MCNKGQRKRPERRGKGAISQSPWKPLFGDYRVLREISLRRRKTTLKAVTRWAVDKNLNQDVRADTMRELWHKLWGKWGLPDERLNTCTGTATDTHRQVHGSLPTLRMNSVTSLSHSSFSSPPLLLSSTAQSKAGLSLLQRKPIFHPLTPPTHPPNPHPLHFRNGCGNTSRHTCFSQSAKGSRRLTSNNNLILLA